MGRPPGEVHNFIFGPATQWRFLAKTRMDNVVVAVSGVVARGDHRRMPKMTFILQDGSRKEVDAPSGLSVLEIAQRNGVELEGACGGACACSTCHVIVGEE